MKIAINFMVYYIEMNYKNFDVNKNKYQLKKVFIFSRHNVRSPLSDGDSILGNITNHSWFDWTSKSGELSLRGFDLEKEVGKYYREYLIDKEFIDNEYTPTEEEVRIYANTKQRTIETARCFAKGLFPNSDLSVEHKEIGTKDPSFNARVNYLSDNYINQVNEEIKQYSKSVDLKDSYKLLEEVLDYSESKMSKDLPHLDPNDFSVTLKLDEEPILNDSLTIAANAVDALKLQYYEDDDNFRAAFNHDLSVQQWVLLSKITDIFIDIKNSLPTISTSIANLILKEIYKELENNNRKITFMCGHDVNISSILGALKVNDYNLPKTFEHRTPIGGAIVIEKWKDKNTSQEYYSICMQYQTIYQLEEIANLNLDLAPVKYRLSFKNLEVNQDGLYRVEDFNNRVLNSIDDFEEIKEKYK